MTSAAGRLLRRQPAAASGSTFTINPSAQSGSVASDVSTLSGSYADARSGSAPAVLNASVGGTLVVGQSYVFQAGDTYTPPSEDLGCREGFLDFNLATLTGSVSTATLSLGLNADFSVQDFTVEARTRDWGTTLTTADWVAGASLGALTLLATLASSGIGAPGAYKAMTESGTALKDAVVAAGTGTLRIILCSDRHRGSNAPSSNEYLILDAYNHATLKPKLVVVTT